MKRTLSLILALLMATGALLAFSACGGENNNGSPEVTAPDPPVGNKLYQNSDFAFAYPEDWILTDSSVVIINDNEETGNNVTVAHEPKTNIYETLTKETFNTTMKPAYDSMGLNISNLQIVQTENANGVAITRIKYTASNASQSMAQTVYAFNAGKRTYSVTVTEVVEDSTLSLGVFNTIYVLKKA